MYLYWRRKIQTFKNRCKTFWVSILHCNQMTGIYMEYSTGLKWVKIVPFLQKLLIRQTQEIYWYPLNTGRNWRCIRCLGRILNVLWTIKLLSMFSDILLSITSKEALLIARLRVQYNQHFPSFSLFWRFISRNFRQDK